MGVLLIKNYRLMGFPAKVYTIILCMYILYFLNCHCMVFCVVMFSYVSAYILTSTVAHRHFPSSSLTHSHTHTHTHIHSHTHTQLSLQQKQASSATNISVTAQGVMVILPLNIVMRRQTLDPDNTARYCMCIYTVFVDCMLCPVHTVFLHTV